MLPTRALILSAGHGTRLRPLSDVRAKPALPVGGEPMIRRIIRWLVAQGVSDLTVNLHHRPETITACVGDGSDLGARVRYSWEHPEVLGSAGGPRQALDIVGADRFFIVNGDVLTDVPLAGLATASERSGALATLALVPNREFLKYGGLILGADGSVVGSVGRGPAAEGSMHFVGPQLVHRDAFASIPRGAVAQTIRGVYDALQAGNPGSVRGAVFADAHYWDVGTVADYWRTSWALSHDAETRHPLATVTRSILWDRVTVGAGASIDECIVTDDVAIPAGARYRRSILLRETEGGIRTSPLDVE